MADVLKSLLILKKRPGEGGRASFYFRTLLSSSNGWDSAATLGRADPLGMVGQKGRKILGD